MSIHEDRLRVMEYLYNEALKSGDVADMEACEQLIARDAPRNSQLYAIALFNYSSRMTDEQFQQALMEVAENIVNPPPPPTTE